MALVPSLISLFSGPGGMDEGFRQAGFRTLLAFDNDAAAVDTFKSNHPLATVKRADLSVLGEEEIVQTWRNSFPPVGLIGGPPCQSFSISNVYQTSDDPRHRLPEHYARILKALNQAFAIHFFVLENVPGLVTKRHREKFARLIALFRDAGFRVFEGSLDAKDFGVAQVRRRVFVVGLNATLYPDVEFEFPLRTVSNPRTVRQAIGHLAEPAHFARSLRVEDIPMHPNHWCMAPRSAKFTNGMLEEGDTRGRSFRVLSWDQPSPTVAYGHREVHIHPTCRRRISVYEAMLLQGFPAEGYILKGNLSDQIRLVSEAVAPPVAKALAEAVLHQLALLPQQQRMPFAEVT